MRLIDADKLELDIIWSDYYEGYISCYREEEIDNAPTVDILSLINQARADAIEEFYNALTSKRCECCNEFRNECNKYGKCFIDEIAEQLKEQNDEV